MTTLQNYAKTRQRLHQPLVQLCEQANLPIPKRFSNEEALMLTLVGRKSNLDGMIALERWRETNFIFECSKREAARHWAIVFTGTLAAGLAGLIVGILEALIETLVIVLSRTVLVTGPAVGIILLALIVQTMRWPGELGFDAVGIIVARALWWGFIAVLCAIVVNATYRLLRSDNEKGI